MPNWFYVRKNSPAAFLILCFFLLLLQLVRAVILSLCLYINVTQAFSDLQFRIRHPFLLALFDLYMVAYELLQHNLYLCLFIRVSVVRFVVLHYRSCSALRIRKHTHIISYWLVRQVDSKTDAKKRSACYNYSGTQALKEKERR